MDNPHINHNPVVIRNNTARVKQYSNNIFEMFKELW